MSFKNYKSTVEEGDVVILYFGIDSMMKLEVTQVRKSKDGTKVVENIYQTKYGAIRPYTLLGKEYGTLVQLTRGWGYILQPTTEIWTKCLPHRTQIIYGPDISMIVTLLDLKPGSTVIEAGTGSASLSHAFINTVKPTGKLYTYDYHSDRVKIAIEEFEQHGLSEWVQSRQADVYADGFTDLPDTKVDAVFLDLPKPWLVLPFTLKILNDEGGRICCFSPCIEQVQTTAKLLGELGFHNIETIELVQTAFNVYNRNFDELSLEVLKNKKVEGECNNLANETIEDKTKSDCKTIQEEISVQQNNDSNKLFIHVPMPETQTGHSGYLTTATFFPTLRNEDTNLNVDEDDENIDTEDIYNNTQDLGEPSIKKLKV